MTDNSDLGTSGKLYFGVDARHVRQLGQELVGDKVTALVELVKNSYDADASYVTLAFETDIDQSAASGLPRSRLTVSDDGSGMSLTDLSNGWMRIASDEKEKSPKSPIYNRTRAGRKGIGRFAAESLGESLSLRTTQAGSPTAVVVTFSWSTDYEAGTDLASVPNRYEIVEAPLDEHGTVLSIGELHGAWTGAQRARVSRALLLLQPPFPIAEVESEDLVRDPGFRVKFYLNGTAQTAESIDSFLDGETAHITAAVDRDGYLNVSVTSKLLGLDRKSVLTDHRYLVVGELKLSASYFVYRGDAIGVPVAAARELGTTYGGVRMYRDGLRLLPYGELNNDWLGLDSASRRRLFLNPIGNQNFFAQVEIGRESNPLLEDTSSREGLLNNEAFTELRDALYLALITAASWVAEHRQRQGKGTDRPKAARRPTRAEILSDAAKKAAEALAENLSASAAAAATEIINSALEVAGKAAADSDAEDKAEIANLQNEVELLRVLASLGTSLAVFSHEVRTVLTVAAAALVRLSREGELDEKTQRVFKRASNAVISLSEIAKYIDAFTGGARQRTRKPQAMHEVIRSFAESFAEPLSRGIEVTWDVSPASLRTAPIGGTVLQAILINLFTNAVKAVDAESQDVRKIHIAAAPSADGKRVRLSVSDSGPGIPEDVRDRMFDAFVTTASVLDNDLGVGTGLGLKVVMDLAEEYGGNASIGIPQDGFNTCVQAEFPRLEAQIE